MYSELVSVTSSFFLYQAIKEPTRHNPSGTFSTIDLAFISSDTEFNTATTIPPLSTSDHLGIKLSIELKTCHVKAKSSSRRTVWLYSKADFNKARDMIYDTDWDQIFSNNSDIRGVPSNLNRGFLYNIIRARSALVSCPASLSNKAKGERESGNFRNFSCICERASLNFQTTNQIVERFINTANNSRISDIIVYESRASILLL